MAGREGVRSSARLSGGTSAAASTPSVSEHVSKEQREAAAALRRARAARAAERAREVEDSPRVLREKCRQLAKVLQEAKHLVVYTGAGISTAADIPDYRGPRGVWTRLQRGETVGRVEVSRARPTFTHMALTALWRRGALKFVVSQNCDGLHLRAGLPRRALAELHGDMFAERCPACRRVYLRAFDTTERTARHAHATRRLCHDCGRELRDSIVHFGERGRAAWPLNWAGALRHAGAADVVLCLGSSLKVLRRYPRLWRMHRAPSARPALYIVNLQWTPKDAVAALKINARCDAVMAQVARRLRLRVPRYDARADPLLAHAEPLAPPEAHTTRRPLLARAPT
ncbi:NAD-dependent protein deacetylase sirtuin-7 [Zerene cesonia]|uniref:NAD-dependent protein deacetylase sirtuin-7 n=1 Tax=Zerene cesonia TaxID=33412 RepID=UPI0018E4E86B|nr:NAD-dependent protein deacetylase sirtuin-7 [Zerene cesonia]